MFDKIQQYDKASSDSINENCVEVDINFSFHFYHQKMKFLWQNTTKVCFGQNAVKENIGKFVKPKSKVPFVHVVGHAHFPGIARSHQNSS